MPNLNLNSLLARKFCVSGPMTNIVSIGIDGLSMEFIDPATIVERRVEQQIGGEHKREKMAYYIHYEGFDKRLDRWAPSDDILY
jgi:hypothetical protein